LLVLLTSVLTAAPDSNEVIVTQRKEKEGLAVHTDLRSTAFNPDPPSFKATHSIETRMDGSSKKSKGR